MQNRFAFLKSELFRLCAISGFFFALVTATDNFIVKQVIVVPGDSITAVLAYLILGSWLGVLTQYILSNLIGRRIYKGFNRIRFVHLKYQRFAIYSGLFSAFATAFSLRGSQLTDPSVVLILWNVVILYLLVWDWSRKQVRILDILLPAGTILVGSVLASIGESFRIGWLVLGILLIGRGLPVAISQLFDQYEQERHRQLDPVNYAFWRFVWLAIWSTIGVLVWIIVSKQTIYFIHFLMSFFIPALIPIFILMIWVTIANATMIAARRTDQASIISLLTTLQVVFVFPITLFGDAIHKGLFGALPTSPLVWLLRIMGSILVILGAIFLHQRRTLSEKIQSESL